MSSRDCSGEYTFWANDVFLSGKFGKSSGTHSLRKRRYGLLILPTAMVEERHADALVAIQALNGCTYYLVLFGQHRPRVEHDTVVFDSADDWWLALS